IEERDRPGVPPEEFLPFSPNDRGVPPMPSFGEGYHTLYSLNPHDEAGNINWDPDVYENMYERVLGKVQDNLDDISIVEGQFTDDADTILVAYGSEFRPAMDATLRARDEGMRVGVLKLGTVWPVPKRELVEASEAADTIISVEMNVGKYTREVERVCAPRAKVTAVTKNRGSIHTAGEIYTAIQEVL
ncbi:ferredoxin oxidoreductase, partial [Candidatus Bipolaricaulota bacterium]|nr:ferredoxin oxidoreductase [Candidatus Bipolaricaulota bacterium]